MTHIGIAQRRARLATRHHLGAAAAAATAPEAARGVVALHATDPATVFLSVRARTRGVDVAAVERALYDQRSLVRMIGMRRTMFVVPRELAAVVHAACGRDIAVAQRRRYGQLIAEGGAGDAAWLAEVEAQTLAALVARGEATGAQLSTDVPRLRTSILLSEGKSYAGRTNVTTWVLFLLGADAHIVRGRPLGSWTSSQYRWSPMDTWLPEGLADLPVQTARAELVRRWLAAFGPGTSADLRWWTGWSAGHVRTALATVGAVQVDLDGETGLVLPDDLEPVAEPDPWVALLPALDPTPMGWTHRSWYLGPHQAALFDRSGNVGPTVWCDGRIVGGWAQRPDGQVVYRLLEDIGRDSLAAVDDAAQRLTAWMGGVRATPRFRTPLERALSA